MSFVQYNYTLLATMKFPSDHNPLRTFHCSILHWGHLPKPRTGIIRIKCVYTPTVKNEV